jgi:HEAT repeat protein
MNRVILIGCALVVVGACASTTTGTSTDFEEYMEPPTFLKAEIEERIASLQYQSGDKLVMNTSRLAYIGEPAVPYLLAALESGEPRTRGSCAYVLGLIGDRRTIVPLREALKDSNAAVRYEIATALCNMGERSGYPVLIDGLSDPDIRNRYKAHEALQLLTRLDYGYRHDDAPSQRQVSVRKWEQWWERMQGSAM